MTPLRCCARLVLAVVILLAFVMSALSIRAAAQRFGEGVDVFARSFGEGMQPVLPVYQTRTH